MKAIARAFAWLNDWILCIVACLIIVIMTWAVFMRYIAHDPLQWVEEVLITIFIWFIMLGAVSAMRVRSHVSIDSLTCMLPTGLQRALATCTDLVCIAALVILGWLGLELALDAGDKITPILMVPYTYIDLAVPVGCFLMALYMIAHLVNDLTGKTFIDKEAVTEEKLT